MNKEEFLEYTSDPNNAFSMASLIDVGDLHIGFERMMSGLEETDPKQAEAIRFMLDNNIPTNFLGYRHLKIN